MPVRGRLLAVGKSQRNGGCAALIKKAFMRAYDFSPHEPQPLKIRGGDTVPKALLSSRPNRDEIPNAVRVLRGSSGHSPSRAILSVLCADICGKLRFSLLSRSVHRRNVQQQEQYQSRTEHPKGAFYGPINWPVMANILISIAGHSFPRRAARYLAFSAILIHIEAR